MLVDDVSRHGLQGGEFTLAVLALEVPVVAVNDGVLASAVGTREDLRREKE